MLGGGDRVRRKDRSLPDLTAGRLTSCTVPWGSAHSSGPRFYTALLKLNPVPRWMSHLDVGAVVQQIQVGGECTGVWLWGKAQPRRALHVHSPGVDGAPGPPQGAVAKDALNGLRKQRLQGGEKASRRRKELPHVASLLPGLCFQRAGKKIHHFRLQTNWAGVGLW